MSDRVGRAVVALAVGYALVLSAVTLLAYEAFATEQDLGIFTQYVWLLGHLHEPFGSITLRPMLEDHFQPTLVLLAPLGTVGIAPQGLLVVQSLAIAAVAPLLLILARRGGATGWLAAAPALMWLVSPVVVKANLFEFHPDSLVPLLLVGAVVAVLNERTWVFWVLIALAAGVKEDVGFTVAALGLALAWTGRRRLGFAVALVGAAWSAVLIFAVLPWLNPPVRELYSGQFVGDRGDGVRGVVTYAVRHPVDMVGSLLTLERLGILVLVVATAGGLCFLAPRWLIVAAPSSALNLLSAYDPQSTLDYHYWLIPAGCVALAGAMGVGRIDLAWRPGWSRGLVVTGCLLTVLSVGALNASIAESRGQWPRRADRLAAIEAIPAGASVATPNTYFARLANRRALYGLPEPLAFGAIATKWGSAERSKATRELEYVVLDSASPAGMSTAELRTFGFEPLRVRGDVTVFARAR